MLHILIADDHGIVRSGLRMLLDKQEGMSVVAEGIENRQHWELLDQLGCDVAQGYYLAKPMPGPELSDWLESWRGG